MHFKLTTAAVLALVRAQTVEADRFNLAEADLVGALGEVIDDANQVRQLSGLVQTIFTPSSC